MCDEVFSGYRVFSPLNHLTRLIARENFVLLSRRESSKSQSTMWLQTSSPEWETKNLTYLSYLIFRVLLWYSPEFSYIVNMLETTRCESNPSCKIRAEMRTN